MLKYLKIAVTKQNCICFEIKSRLNYGDSYYNTIQNWNEICKYSLEDNVTGRIVGFCNQIFFHTKRFTLLKLFKTFWYICL
jgi:hypothetical protein